MNTFTIIFVSLLGLSLLTELWLANRHIRHVATHRNTVPEAFRHKISLADHQKAADYTVARTRFGRIEDVYGTVLLVLWTVGGGLELLDHAWSSFGWGELATGTGFMLSAFVIMGLLELPTSIYQTFVIENRFGFNKITAACSSPTW